MRCGLGAASAETRTQRSKTDAYIKNHHIAQNQRLTRDRSLLPQAILTLAACYAAVMSEKDRAQGMKSAYELALERLERQGIERPREETFSDALRAQIAEARSQTQAKLAELEILHKDRLRKIQDPIKFHEEEEEYRRERQRIEADGERKVAKARGEL